MDEEWRHFVFCAHIDEIDASQVVPVGNKREGCLHVACADCAQERGFERQDEGLETYCKACEHLHLLKPCVQTFQNVPCVGKVQLYCSVCNKQKNPHLFGFNV